MSGYPGIPVDYDGSLKRGLEIVQEQGRQALERDEAQREATERQVEAQWQARFAVAQFQAVSELRELRDLYAKRDTFAQEASGAILAFYETEQKIRNREAEVSRGLSPFTASMTPESQERGWSVLRSQAGLPEHSALPEGLPAIVRTLFAAIVARVVLPGAVKVGSKAITFNV